MRTEGSEDNEKIKFAINSQKYAKIREFFGEFSRNYSAAAAKIQFGSEKNFGNPKIFFGFSKLLVPFETS